MSTTDRRVAHRTARGQHAASGATDPLQDPLGTDPLVPPVQFDADRAPGRDVRAVAEKTVAGSGEPLPHLERIQGAFGKHDVSGVTAHRDTQATAGLGALGARGLATGSRVALATDDLHTVAHEAAHTVQQQHGVSLDRGVGEHGDPYERHADAVADTVVAGGSAEALLDTLAGGAPGVQRKAVQFTYDPSTGLYADRPSKPSSMSGPDEVSDPLTAHHLYPWNKIRDDLNKALKSKSRTEMEKLLAWAQTSVDESFWTELAKEPSDRSTGFTAQVNTLAAEVCWSPSNVFMGPLNNKRGDDPNEGLDTMYSKSGLPTPSSALAELLSKRGGITKVGDDEKGGGKHSQGSLTEILMRNVREASDGKPRAYDAREWEDKSDTDNRRVRRGKVPLDEKEDKGWKPSVKVTDIVVKAKEEKKPPTKEEIEKLQEEARLKKAAKALEQQDDEDDNGVGGLFD